MIAVMHRRVFLYSLVSVSAIFPEMAMGGNFPPQTAAIAEALQPFVEDKTIAGAVALVVSPEKILSLDTIGLADLQSGRVMGRDSIFWIASMTKPMTAMGLMMLVEEGRLSIDDAVEKHLPEFSGQKVAAGKDEGGEPRLVEAERKLTVKDLLTHTNGLTASGESYATLAEAVASYAKRPLQFQPGSRWSYSNPGINTLGRLIEVLGGKPYEQFMQERFFDPLGMKDTTFWLTEPQGARLATSYKPSASGASLEPTTIRFLNDRAPTDRNRMPVPAGGLFSTAHDLSRIYRMVLNSGELEGRRYLKAETLKLMRRNHTGDLKVSFADGMHMGLGFHVVNEPVGVTAALSRGSFGHGGAYGTQAWLDPVRRLGIVLLIQRAGLPNSDQSAIRAALQKAAVEAFGKLPQ